MPLYTYVCEQEDCKHKFEKIVPFAKGDEPMECEKCGKPAPRTYDCSGTSFRFNYMEP